MKNIQKLKNGTFRATLGSGKRREQPTFKNKADAQKWVIERRKFLERAPEQAFELKTLEDLINKYVDTLTEAQKRAGKANQNFWMAFLGERKIENLKRIDFEDGKELLRKQGYSPNTINSRICFIKQVIKYAYCRWECISEDITKHLKMKSITEFRDRVLDDQERVRLFKEAKKCTNDLVLDAITIGFDTGMRISEILNLTIKNCDFEKGVIKIENTKSKETRYNYMSDEVKKVLLKRAARHSKFIFQNAKTEKPISSQHLSICFKRVVKAAEIDNFLFHDIRHNHATDLAETNMPLPNLMALLGHKSLNITKRYVHCQTESNVTMNQYYQAINKRRVRL